MRLSELSERLAEALSDPEPVPGQNPIIMIKDKKTKVMYEVSEIILEVSEEGDAHTLWIEIDEY